MPLLEMKFVAILPAIWMNSFLIRVDLYDMVHTDASKRQPVRHDSQFTILAAPLYGRDILSMFKRLESRKSFILKTFPILCKNEYISASFE